jgi:hypothetical protein
LKRIYYKNTVTEKTLLNIVIPEGFFIGLPFTIQLTPEAKRNLANYIDKEYS